MTVEEKAYKDIKFLASRITNMRRQCDRVASAIAALDSAGFVDKDGNHIPFPSGGWTALVTRFENLGPSCAGSAFSTTESVFFALADPPQFDGHDLETEIQEFMKELKKEEINALEIREKLQKLLDDINLFAPHFHVFAEKARGGPTKEKLAQYESTLYEVNTIWAFRYDAGIIVEIWTKIHLDMQRLYEALWAQLKDGPLITKSFFRELKVAKEIYGPLHSFLTSYVTISIQSIQDIHTVFVDLGTWTHGFSWNEN
ncbi:hypothetical protein B0H16DRAFT_1799272 [Mycena metata]|uniref:Uncharacterized protein n=1 Tax=Mycena metata TaxID=1033252 RepID=A0AAD7HCN0_9AGAR|nr:hypothetical protein B0H16DRAFT_1799272 [Mycena metata]